MKEGFTIDWFTMRENCIQIHQETAELFRVATHIGEDLGLIVNSADELRTNEQTKVWEGMGKFANDIYNNTALWDKLPSNCRIVMCDDSVKMWNKEKARAEFKDCFLQLGGKNLL